MTLLKQSMIRLICLLVTVILMLMSRPVAASDMLVIKQGMSRVVYLKSKVLNTAMYTEFTDKVELRAGLVPGWSRGKECAPLSKCKKLIVSAGKKAKPGVYKINLMKKDRSGNSQLVSELPVRIIEADMEKSGYSESIFGTDQISVLENGEVLIVDSD